MARGNCSPGHETVCVQARQIPEGPEAKNRQIPAGHSYGNQG